LCVENVGHRFGHHRVFADLNLAVQAPGSVCVTGPNGSGKSTLLRIIAGLLHPTRGQVLLRRGEERLMSTSFRNRLGFVSPDLKLYGELSALENLTFFARLRGLPNSHLLWRDQLAEVGLAEQISTRVGHLSSGQQQRLKYCVALQHRPLLLLLDEPSANLDDPGRRLVAEIVARQRRQGLLVVATNDREEYSFGDCRVRLVA
jgi:heme exporter protein A